MTVETRTRCPWCRTRHECATGVGAETPIDGDRTLCIRCGEISIFDAKAAGGLRKPSAIEREELTRNKLIFDVRWAWFVGVRGAVK